MPLELTNFDVHGPSFLLGILPQLGNRVSQIWCEGTIDKGLQLPKERAQLYVKSLTDVVTSSKLISMSWSYSAPSSGTNISLYFSASFAIAIDNDVCVYVCVWRERERERDVHE